MKKSGETDPSSTPKASPGVLIACLDGNLYNFAMISAYFLIIGLLLLAPSVQAQSPPDFPAILKLINIDSPGEPRYYVGDVTDADRHGMDLNGDGLKEWVIVPNTGCGETNNCSYYILAAHKKGWRLILRGEGKLTSLTPYGFVAAPRKTQGYADLISVWDQGPEGDGTRSLDRKIYVFNGTQYERFTEAYPPPGSSSDLNSLMTQVEKLKYQRWVKPQPPAQ